MGIRIAPSILSADFANLAQEIGRVTEADALHLDVMDGHFVPNLTFGPPLVAAVRRVTNLPLDVHLMIEAPERYLQRFVEAGANSLTVHVETCPHLHRTVHQIRELGVGVGVALNPATPPTAIEYVLEAVDQVLVMTVNPGFGGQAFIPAMLAKIRRVRAWVEQRGLAVSVAVDGGIGPDTVRSVVAAGADYLVAGAAVFGAPDPGAAMVRMRELARES